MAKMVGYARAASAEELNLQIEALNRKGCSTLFCDLAVGGKSIKPQRDLCLKTLTSGDVLWVWRIDRLAGSVTEILKVSSELRTKGVNLCSVLDSHIENESLNGTSWLASFEALARADQVLAKERAGIGLLAAKTRGRLGGRKPGPVDISKLKRLRSIEKQLTVAEVCKELSISKATYYRYRALARATDGK